MKIYLMVLFSYIKDAYNFCEAFYQKYDKQITDILAAFMTVITTYNMYEGQPAAQITLQIIAAVYWLFHGRTNGGINEVSE